MHKDLCRINYSFKDTYRENKDSLLINILVGLLMQFFRVKASLFT